MLLTLAQQRSPFLSREVLAPLFYFVRPEVLKSVVKPWREACRRWV